MKRLTNASSFGRAMSSDDRMIHFYHVHRDRHSTILAYTSLYVRKHLCTAALYSCTLVCAQNMTISQYVPDAHVEHLAYSTQCMQCNWMECRTCCMGIVVKCCLHQCATHNDCSPLRSAHAFIRNMLCHGIFGSQLIQTLSTSLKISIGRVVLCSHSTTWNPKLHPKLYHLAPTLK